MPTSVRSWPGRARGGPARSTRSLATGSSRSRFGRRCAGIARTPRSAVRVIHSVVSCARIWRPVTASTSSGPFVRGNAASSLSAPAEALPAVTLRRAAGDSARRSGAAPSVAGRRRRDRRCAPAAPARAGAPTASRRAASRAARRARRGPARHAARSRCRLRARPPPPPRRPRRSRRPLAPSASRTSPRRDAARSRLRPRPRRHPSRAAGRPETSSPAYRPQGAATRLPRQGDEEAAML